MTFTGKRFYPLDPNPNDVCIEDIAHALAYKCRFTGHCTKFYSVAEHSVRVSRAVESPTLELAALLHDSAEAYLPDIAGPIKYLFEVYDGRTFEEVERTVLCAIVTGLGLENQMVSHPLVKRADLILLATERRDLMPPHQENWGLPDPLPDRLEVWSPELAENTFLRRFKNLTGRPL